MGSMDSIKATGVTLIAQSSNIVAIIRRLDLKGSFPTLGVI